MRSGDGLLSLVRLWSLREDTLVEFDHDGDRVVVITASHEIDLGPLGGPGSDPSAPTGQAADADPFGPVVRESLRRMALGPISLANVLPPRHLAGGQAAWDRLGHLLDRLAAIVVHSLGAHDGQPLLSVVPVAESAAFRLPLLQPRHVVRLCRFAGLRPVAGEMVLESPIAPYRVLLHRNLACRVAVSLANGVSVADLAMTLRVARPVVTDLVAYLVAAGVVVLADPVAPGESSRFAEDDEPMLDRWTHHTAHFHAASGRGFGVGPAGAVFPHADRSPPPPALRPAPAGPAIPLHRPDPAALADRDPSLSRVIDAPLPVEPVDPPTVEQVGELLYRVARVRSRGKVPPLGPTRGDVTDRPHFDSLGLYELELYLSLDRCPGLAPDTYYYNPDAHALTALGRSAEELGELLDRAAIATGTARRPPVLLTITLRVDRSSWVYRDIGYATALTHVGALQQLVSLSATAMGLPVLVAPFEPGEVVDRALGLDWLVETAVGDCAIG
jgi:SagB-type dehydrogenase family enzyme